MAIDPRFIVNLRGRDFPLYCGVLDLAHREGLVSITTELVQIPSAENGMTAIVKATASFERAGRAAIFEAYGDACPANVKEHLATALLRLAETRAKGRALRDGVNVGQALLEELPDTDELPTSAAPDIRPAPREKETGAAPICSAAGCGKPLTKGQYEVSLRAYGQPMCPACQKEAARAQEGAKR
jgi:hypothetical protein